MIVEDENSKQDAIAAAKKLAADISIGLFVLLVILFAGLAAPLSLHAGA